MRLREFLFRTGGRLLLGLILVTSLAGQTPRKLERRDTPGYRADLSEARLFVPEGVRPRKGRIDLVVHLHGAAWVAEQALVEAKWNAALISVTLKGLSSVYDKHFRDPKRFGALLETGLAALRKRKGFAKVRFGHVVLSSFSAGYGGVRRILKNEADVGRIDALLLADSLHAGYDATKRPRAAQMKPFLAWARRAAAGKKLLWLTHSAIRPGSYASTTETADVLIEGIEASRKKTAATNAWGLRLETAVDKGGFHVRGYAGTTGQDHMRHLWFLAEPFAELKKRLR